MSDKISGIDLRVQNSGGSVNVFPVRSITYTGTVTDNGNGNVTLTGGSGSGMTIGDPITGATPDLVLYADASGNLAQHARFKYDGAINQLLVTRVSAPAALTPDQISAIYCEYIRSNGTSDVIAAIVGYAQNTGSNGGSGHTIGGLFFVEDTTNGQQFTYGIEGKNKGYSGISGQIYTGALGQSIWIGNLRSATSYMIGVQGDVQNWQAGAEGVTPYTGVGVSIAFYAPTITGGFSDADNSQSFSFIGNNLMQNNHNILMKRSGTQGYIQAHNPSDQSKFIAIYHDDTNALVSASSGNLVYSPGSGGSIIIGSGNLVWLSDDTYDIGTSGAFRPRDAYFSRDIYLGADIEQLGGSTGVKISAASGAMTIAGIGNTNNENLKFDFEGTANAVNITSSSGVQNFRLGNGLGLGWANSTPSTVSRIDFNTSETNDSMKWGLAVGSATAGSGNLIICEFADISTNFGAPIVSNPTLRIQSADATTTSDFIQFFHDQTRARIQAGVGLLGIGGSGGTNNEDLTFDFETTADRVRINSSTSANPQFDITTWMANDTSLLFGTSGTASNRSKIRWVTTGNDNWQFGVGTANSATGSGYMSIMREEDVSNANRSPSGTSSDPVLRIYSGDNTQASDYLEFYHDQTDPYIKWGNGGLSLSAGSTKVARFLETSNRLLLGDTTGTISFFPTAEQKFTVASEITAVGQSSPLEIIRILNCTIASINPVSDTNLGSLPVVVYGGQGFNTILVGSNKFNGGLPIGGLTDNVSAIGAFGQTLIRSDDTVDGVAGLLCVASHEGYGSTGAKMWGGVFASSMSEPGGIGTGTGSAVQLVGGFFTSFIEANTNATTGIAGQFLEPYTSTADSYTGAFTNKTAIDLLGTISIKDSDVATAASITNMAVATSVIRMTGSTATNLHGIHADTFNKLIFIYNVSSATVTIKHQSATEGTAANRIISNTGADVAITTGKSACLWYDDNQLRWILLLNS